jgi:hypothetical protein
MSQVDKFNQLNNPDYVYFDLQQTNIYNTTTQEQQPLKFLETRETPIIKNTGDYYMSVARFQLDTYNLPVIVGEPDLTQTGTFDPDKTIYKVAMNITNGSVTTTEILNPTAYTLTAQTTVTGTAVSSEFGFSVKTASTGTKNDICVAVSDPNYNSGDGTVLIWKGTTTTNSIQHTLTANSFVQLGASIGISNAGLRAVASAVSTPNVYLYNIVNGTNITTYSHIITPYPTAEAGATQTTIAGNGNFLWIGKQNTGSDGGLSRFYNFSTQAQVGAEIGQTGILNLYNKGAMFSTDANYWMTSGYLHDTAKGYVEFRRFDGFSNYVLAGQFTGPTAGDRLGYSFAMSGNGVYACAVANRTSDIGNFIHIYKRSGTDFTHLTGSTITGINSIGWGESVSMSNDGSTIIVSAFATTYIYKRGTGVETYTLFSTNTVPSINPSLSYGRSISITNNGEAFFLANSGGTIYNYTLPDSRPSGTVIPLPSNISSTSTIESVKWIKDLEDATAPTQNSLTGRNTALYPYYYCNSYNNFITMVNKTLKLAYKNLMEFIYNNWIVGINDAGITNQFLSISARQYPTPPFIDWNESNLTADVYVSMLFETYQTAANAVIANINYAMPETTWASGGGNSVGTPVKNTPFKFELAFNAPLYSLFSSLPATKKVITNSTGKRELYYTLNFYSSGIGLVNPSPALNSIIAYTFLSTYTNASTGVVTIPTTGTDNYSHQKLLIKQSQEISTIDTWTPVNAIVFTTTSIPIIVNQFTASSSIGSSPPSSSLDNAFAFIITDLQSNQQGYRPNILLTPKIYRMIDLTGNQSLKNIDINVFWRTKTGTLIPFTLASGAMSSIKLLFQKKVLGENQQINLASMSVRNIQ